MEKCHSNIVYNPTGETMPFVVHFDTDPEPEQCQRVGRAIAHLEKLEHAALVAESHKFYKWIVLYTVSVCHIHYATRLLQYFHARGLLQCKQRVNKVTDHRRLTL